MHFSDPVAAPRVCVFFLLMAPVDEPVNRLSLKECFPVTCFGLCFLRLHTPLTGACQIVVFFFVFWINVLNKVQAQSSEQSALA